LDPLALVDPVSFTPPPPPDIATLSLHDALPIFYIHLDAHNDLSPGIYPYQSRMLRTDWWPADAGNNANLLDHFSRWAYEDPANKDRKSTRLNSSHVKISYAVFCLKKKRKSQRDR